MHLCIATCWGATGLCPITRGEGTAHKWRKGPERSWGVPASQKACVCTWRGRAQAHTGDSALHGRAVQPGCRAPASKPPDAGTGILAPMQEPSDFAISSSFLLYAMRIIKAAISWGHGRVNQVNTHKVLRECLPYSSNSGPHTYLSSVNGEPAKRVFSCSSGE